MQPVDPGGAILRGHEEVGDELLCLGDSSGTWFRYFNVFLPDSSTPLWLLPALVLRLVSDPLLGAAMLGTNALEGFPQADAERVLLVCELVDEITSVAPQ